MTRRILRLTLAASLAGTPSLSHAGSAAVARGAFARGALLPAVPALAPAAGLNPDVGVGLDVTRPAAPAASNELPALGVLPALETPAPAAALAPVAALIAENTAFGVASPTLDPAAPRQARPEEGAASGGETLLASLEPAASLAPAQRGAWLDHVYEQGRARPEGALAAADLGGGTPLEQLAASRGPDSPAPPDPPAPRTGGGQAPSRIPALDAARGLAILGMIPRNLAGILLAATVAHPLWFIALGALVPALFMTINGFVIAHSAQKKASFGYYLQRGLRLALVSGVVIDAVIWNNVPFTAVDVLLTISFLIPAAYLVQKLKPAYQLAAAAAAFGLAFPLQAALGYSAYPTEMTIPMGIVSGALVAASFLVGNELFKRKVMAKGKAAASGLRRLAWGALSALLFAAPLVYAFSLPAKPTDGSAVDVPVWHHYLVDGWFPLFPWLGFGFLGVYLATRFRQFFASLDPAAAAARAARFFKGALWAGLALLTAGLASWLLLPPEVAARGGYTIPIFPPTWQYLVTAVGGVLTLLGAFYTARESAWVQRPYAFLQTMGRRSLEIYVLHLAIGQLLFLTLFGWAGLGGWAFVGAALLAIALCYGTAWLLERYKAAPWL